MFVNYIFYWVVWHVINYNFDQVFVILITFLVTFLITFLHSLRKMCHERTKIKICHKCFSTFLIPSAFFLQQSWITTITFYLRITSRIFPSTHYRPVQYEYHVSWVCMAGPNCLWVTTLWPRHITYITYMTSMQCRIMYSYYTTQSSVYHSDSLFNVS